MNQHQPCAWRIEILKENPSSLRSLALAAKRMLEAYDDNRLGSPYNYTCNKLPRFTDYMYSSTILSLLGQEFAWHNYGVVNAGSAFINMFVDNTYYYIVEQDARICSLRRAAYTTHRKMWLNYIINMAELYAPLD